MRFFCLSFFNVLFPVHFIDLSAQAETMVQGHCGWGFIFTFIFSGMGSHLGPLLAECGLASISLS